MVSKLSLVHVICVEGWGGGMIKPNRLAYKKKDRVKKVVKATNKARSFTFLSCLHIYIEYIHVQYVERISAGKLHELYYKLDTP